MQSNGGNGQVWVCMALMAIFFLCGGAGAFEASGFQTIFHADGEAAQPGCRLLNPEKCPVVELGGRTVRQGPKEQDPYSSAEWKFDLDAPSVTEAGRFTLCIVHPDVGAGVIQPQLFPGTEGNHPGPERLASFTVLNTGQTRTAYFEFSIPPVKIWPKNSPLPHLTISGLSHLAELRVGPPLSDADWAAIRAGIPRDLSPMVTLSRPMELVTTAGIAVSGQDEAALASSLDALADYAPLARVLGFTSVETYVAWNTLEPEAEGSFDFHFYDAVVDRLSACGLKWFPLLIVGSAYALPDWFAASPENTGFVCLEHGLSNPVQSIWSPWHRRHVTRVLKAFGDHYGPKSVLEGVRLGPSGNYGESQYPAGGNWGYKGESMHIHIGYWAGDAHAKADFQQWLKRKYGTVDQLNAAWDNATHQSFDVVSPALPQLILSKRERLDVTAWYTDSMSAWCDWWARETRTGLPETLLYQSAGGWGFREAGTDYPAQTKTMAELGGGIRLTNETDSFEQNFYATRLAMTSARLYGARIGSEPASSHTARGIAGRLYNLLTANGDHFFTYQGNIMTQPMAIESWLETLPAMDTRRPPLVEIAVYYPETMNQLDDATFRQLYAWGFNPRAAALRRVADVDYLDETLIRDGFLDRYKALVVVWGGVVEADVQEKIDQWLRRGGALFYPTFPRADWETVEGNRELTRRWAKGDTGDGAFFRFKGDMEPPSLYARFVRDTLLSRPGLHPWTRTMMEIPHPEDVFLSVQDDGHLLVLNYGAEAADLELPGGEHLQIPPWRIRRAAL